MVKDIFNKGWLAYTFYNHKISVALCHSWISLVFIIFLFGYIYMNRHKVPPNCHLVCFTRASFLSHICNKKCSSRPSDVYINDDVKKILGRWGAVFLFCINQNLLLNIFYQFNKKISGHFLKIQFQWCCIDSFLTRPRPIFFYFLAVIRRKH